jgi:hypothetical protein
MRGAPEKREVIPGSLIDKLLNNPHAAIRREPQRWRPSADTEHQKRHAGERWAVKKTNLTAQQPLLDGGEGELLPRSENTKLDTHDEQRIVPTGENTSSLPSSGLPAVDHNACNLSGLEPPSLDNTGGVVTGADTPKHRIENKRRRQATLANQELKCHWTITKGNSSYLSHQPPLRGIGGKCARLAWLSFTPQQTSSRNGLPTGVLPEPERHGRKNRYKLQ